MMKNNIKKIIKEKGLKTEFVISKLNISKSAFYTILNEKSVPSLVNAREIANALGEPVDKVFPNDNFETSTKESIE